MSQLITALLLTIIIENAVLCFRKVGEKEDYFLMTLVNVVTNIPANILYSMNLKYNVINRYLCMLVIEAAVVLVEQAYMRKYLKTDIDPLTAALIINAASFAGGVIWNYFF